jgi:alkanesulfonate monooxygenase SsuD/methylene tetrahydromethanopterin reductase-like flavin-dependent oxidoreductase (luciferase family)
MVPFSVLDICPVVEGGDVRQSLENNLNLARHAERLGYRRFWFAEHHNMPGVASAATSVVIGHVAAGTPFALVLAASCCPIMRRWSSPSRTCQGVGCCGC